jgi:hypothetical protein
MKTIFEHIEYVKGQPHHIRKQITLAIAGGLTALIALVWFFGTLSSGAFAIHGSTFAESTGAEPAAVTGTDNSSDSGIAGAAAAINSDTNAPAHIEIVDTSTSTNAKKPAAEPTIIPF